MYHVRADLEDPAVDRLARAFGANTVLYGEGEEGSLRSTATADGIPTITVEMGRAQRFQPAMIENAIAGTENVLAEYGLLPEAEPATPSWHTETAVDSTKQ